MMCNVVGCKPVRPNKNERLSDSVGGDKSPNYLLHNWTSTTGTLSVSDDGMNHFMRSSIVENILESVPFVDVVANEKLKEAGIVTTYQLFGKYLSFRGPDMDTQEHTEHFDEWLKEIGIRPSTGQSTKIARAISNRANIMIPGI